MATAELRNQVQAGGLPCSAAPEPGARTGGGAVRVARVLEQLTFLPELDEGNAHSPALSGECRTICMLCILYVKYSSVMRGSVRTGGGAVRVARVLEQLTFQPELDEGNAHSPALSGECRTICMLCILYAKYSSVVRGSVRTGGGAVRVARVLE